MGGPSPFVGRSGAVYGRPQAPGMLDVSGLPPALLPYLRGFAGLPGLSPQMAQRLLMGRFMGAPGQFGGLQLPPEVLAQLSHILGITVPEPLPPLPPRPPHPPGPPDSSTPPTPPTTPPTTPPSQERGPLEGGGDFGGGGFGGGGGGTGGGGLGGGGGAEGGEWDVDWGNVGGEGESAGGGGGGSDIGFGGGGGSAGEIGGGGDWDGDWGDWGGGWDFF